MPGMPVFQLSPSQLKGQMFVQNSSTSEIEALTVNSAGSLPVAGEVSLASGATVGLTAGTTVGLAAGAEIIGLVQNDLVFTNLDAFDTGTTVLTPVTVAATTTVDSEEFDISKESSYNFYIINQGDTSANQEVTVQAQLSPDGTNWINDGDSFTLAYNDTASMVTFNNFLQYARFTVTGGTEGTTVAACYQAQH